jgi:hypothetical protein
MDRRAFFLGMMGAAAASTALVAAAGQAEAAPLPVAKPAGEEAERLESDYRPEVDGAAKTEDAQYVYYYRPRRRYYRRRVYYYRPVRRRRIYRRRYYRRRYYW